MFCPNKLPDALLGTYEGILGHMDVWFHTVTISHEGSLPITVSCQDITDVIFQSATQKQNGFLVFRSADDSRPIPKSVADAQWDETALVFTEEMNDRVCALYESIKHSLDSAKQVLPQNGQKTNEICCPRCGSGNYAIQQNRFSLPYGWGKSLLLALTRLILTVYYAAKKEPKVFVCNACGHEWSK